MSVHDEHARTAAAPAEEDTRDGSQPSRATSTQPGTTAALSAEVLAQIRRAGLALPRQPFPGQGWSPSTPAEQHLLREGYRLDRLRQVLLVEIGRLRRFHTARAARQATRAVHVPGSPCPLSDTQLRALIGAASGESPREAARRVLLAENTIRKQRLAAQERLGARSLTHAVAVAVAAGWITAAQIIEGTTP